MKLFKDGITIEQDMPLEIARFKKIGFVEVVDAPEPEPVKEPVKELEVVVPKAVAEPKKAGGK